MPYFKPVLSLDKLGLKQGTYFKTILSLFYVYFKAIFSLLSNDFSYLSQFYSCFMSILRLFSAYGPRFFPTYPDFIHILCLF